MLLVPTIPVVNKLYRHLSNFRPQIRGKKPHPIVLSGLLRQNPCQAKGIRLMGTNIIDSAFLLDSQLRT